MARVLYGQGVSAFKGSIGGTVFSTNVAGPFAANKPLQRFSFSPRRKNNLINLGIFTSMWYQLEPSERDEWNEYAANHDYIDPFGVIKKISGYHWFVHCNSNLYRLDSPFILSPPVYPVPVNFPRYYIVIDEDHWAMLFPAATPIDDTYIFLNVTPPISKVSLYFKNKLRNLLEIPTSDRTLIDIQPALNSYFGFEFPLTDPVPLNLFGVGSIAYYVDRRTGLSGFGFVTWYGYP